MRFLEQLLMGITGREAQQSQAWMASSGSAQGAALFEEVGKMITQAGGVEGLARQFQHKGFGDMVTGWIGTGANPAINEEQIASVLGQERIESIAASVGLTEKQTIQGISKLLPVLIDKLTPSGNVMVNQAPEEIQSDLMILKSKFL